MNPRPWVEILSTRADERYRQARTTLIVLGILLALTVIALSFLVLR